ncbi:hypothetical protein Hanom_Chr16g01477831 [Helianthus anomalus]
MDGVYESDENGKISNLSDPNVKKKTNLWMKAAKLAKPQGRKWHFTLKKLTKYNVCLPKQILSLQFHEDLGGI